MAQENVLRFRLDGIEYTLKGDIGQERMREVISLVEDKLSSIRGHSPNYSNVRAATLAALQRAEELLALREENDLIFAEANIGASARQTPPPRPRKSAAPDKPVAERKPAATDKPGAPSKTTAPAPGSASPAGDGDKQRAFNFQLPKREDRAPKN